MKDSGMIHFSCDRCKRVLGNDELRYVVRLEVQAMVDPVDGEELDDDRDHLLELHEILERLDDEDADYVVRVHIHRFEGVPPDVAHLSATWTLLDDSGNVLHSSTHDDRNQGWVFENYGHLAEKLDESLASLAGVVVDHLPG